MPLTRRDFLRGAAVSAGLPLWGPAPAALAQGGRDPSALFQHGVASGDPLTNRVILWTRVTPPPTRSATGPIEVTWEVASDERLTRPVARGSAPALPARDFTVKVDAAGLQAGRDYYYAFTAGGQRSPVGRTRTLPSGATSHLQLAVVSCANYPAGYFNAYRCIARRGDVDLVVHLGDYIYEKAEAAYEDTSGTGRVPLAAGYAATLDEYRRLYATYRTDPDLQEIHRRHPFVVTWDDHEIANNAWSAGAKDHSATDGDWRTRLAAAYQAYTEWLPIREGSGVSGQMYRSFRIGDLADLIVLDTRSFRDQQLPEGSLAGLDDANRTLLGGTQEQWLFEEFRMSTRRGARWRLLAQQVLFSSMAPSGIPMSPDMWDGYPAARARILDVLAGERIADVVILTGDLHSSWALDVARDPWAAAGSAAARAVAVEAVAPAVSSPPLFTDTTIREDVTRLRTLAPHLRFLEGTRNGYVLVDLTRRRVRADWYFVPAVIRTSSETRAERLMCERGHSRWIAS
jgi:alkaline phosphatase D